jgi:hypothetical protein
VHQTNRWTCIFIDYENEDSGIWIEAVAVIEIELPEETNLNAASIYLNIQMKLIDMVNKYICIILNFQDLWH